MTNHEFLQKISDVMYDVLLDAGWAVFVEDDYADLKHYIYTRDYGIADAEAFTRFDIVLMLPALAPGEPDGLQLYFLFYADPARIGADKRAFGRKFRKDDFSILRNLTNGFLEEVRIYFEQPTVRVRTQSCNRLNFGNGEPVYAAYEVELYYWIEGVSKYERLRMMAKIGTYDNHLVYIFLQPGQQPSFNVQYQDEWEVVLNLFDFSILEVKHGPFIEGSQLPDRERMALLAFLSFERDRINNWEFLILTWNMNNEDSPVPMDTPLPS